MQREKVFLKFANSAAAAAAGAAAAGERMFYREVEVRAAGGNELGERQFEFIASDETPDSYGDIVRAEGWDLKRYKRNPIILYNHKSDVPVGYSPKTYVEGKQLKCIVQLADEGTSDFIDTLYKLMKQRIVRAMSVGFRATADVAVMYDKDKNFLGLEFNGQELLENSIVTIPANPNALSLAKSLGARDSTLQRLAEQDAIVQASVRQRQIDLLRLGVSSK
jgi:HK97 family phage prohead protease